MAIKLTSKTNTDPVSAAYPWGNIKNETTPGSGTPIDVQVYGDFHQFFAKLLADAGLTGNDQPDNATNGFQYAQALAKLIAKGAEGEVSGSWTTPAALSFAASGTGTVTLSAGDIIYNKFKLTGRTFIWQIQLRTVTISGSPTAILITLPAEISGLTPSLFWANSNAYIPAGFYNFNTALLGSISGYNLIIGIPGGTAFTNGTNNQSFDITVYGELKS